jgi:DedD protein
MAKQAEDQNIKSRARRRLIGAIALALAVVVILPMVLDSEPKINGKDIELSIPSPEKAGEFVPAVAISEVVEAGMLADSGVSSASEVAATSDVVPQATASGKITHTEAKSDAGNQAGKLDAKESEPKSAAQAEPVKAKSAEKSTLSPAEKKAENSALSYIVQVAAFANAETATQQAEQLKTWGFKAYTEMISGTTRVRVGPYADRKSAEEVRMLLEKHNLHPVIKASK